MKKALLMYSSEYCSTEYLLEPLEVRIEAGASSKGENDESNKKLEDIHSYS